MNDDTKKAGPGPGPPKRPKLLELVRTKMRLLHMSYVTEKSYIHWIKRFIFFHKMRHPDEMGAPEITQFLSFLAEKQNVAIATQNQALNSVVFLYKQVLGRDPGEFKDIVWAKKPPMIPVVLSVEEVKAVLRNLKGVQWTIGCLLYGTGMRLAEALQLRVKDLDFANNLIIVRNAKGNKDRRVPLPTSLRTALQKQLQQAKAIHEKDLKEGFGKVSLPFALERKYPNANVQWCWQYVFPSVKRSVDPRSRQIKRHHLYDNIMQDAMRRAVKSAGISKKVNCHTLRHSNATHLLDSGTDVRTLQTLLGHSDLKTTMIYLHVTKEKGLAVRSPLDVLNLNMPTTDSSRPDLVKDVLRGNIETFSNSDPPLTRPADSNNITDGSDLQSQERYVHPELFDSQSLSQIVEPPKDKPINHCSSTESSLNTASVVFWIKRVYLWIFGSL